MRAIVVDSGKLTLETVPDPVAGPGEVVIDVTAAGVNRADLLQRRGLYPPPPGAPETLGLEVSGRIAALGENVDEWSVGDEVCALLAGGGYAEKVAVPSPQVLPRPASVDLLEAGGLPEASCTVYSNIIMIGNLQDGDTLLVHGGSSGIGTNAIQVGRAVGARVATTARTAEKLSRCSELGAEILINYTEQNFADVMAEHGGADVILDIIGAKYLEPNVASLATDGRLMIIGMQGGTTSELSIATLLGKRGAIFGTTLRSRPIEGPDGKARIVEGTREFTWPLIDDGEVLPVIDSVFPLADADAAQARLDSGDAIGKVLLRVAD
ncbi:NAD(P)H-quinone oxidoreductase [Gordonia sinesedis]